MNNLPNELLFSIFTLIDPKTISTSSRVCKRWKTLIDDERLWKILCENLWPSVRLEQPNQWKWHYKLLSSIESKIYLQFSKEILPLPKVRDICSLDLMTQLTNGELCSIRVCDSTIRVKNHKTNEFDIFNKTGPILAHKLFQTTFVTGDMLGKISVVDIEKRLQEDLFALPEIKQVATIDCDATQIACAVANSNKIYLYNRKQKQIEEVIDVDNNCIESIHLENDYIIYTGRPQYAMFTHLYRFDRKIKKITEILYKEKPFWTWSGSGRSLTVSGKNLVMSRQEGSPAGFDYEKNASLPEIIYYMKRSASNDCYHLFHHILFIGTSSKELYVFDLNTGKELYRLKIEHSIHHITMSKASLFLTERGGTEKPMRYTQIKFAERLLGKR